MASVMQCGAWKSFEDLEENISLDELFMLAEAIQDEREWQAALAGADLKKRDQSETVMKPLSLGDGAGMVGYEIEE